MLLVHPSSEQSHRKPLYEDCGNARPQLYMCPTALGYVGGSPPSKEHNLLSA
uniref:Uncharacterized protein n=1 Tax=Anguilla anguilla TaxID=7936 RepID=A0A0E9TUU4_ANGAN